jgi:CRP-like cAMP-binding protein
VPAAPPNPYRPLQLHPENGGEASAADNGGFPPPGPTPDGAVDADSAPPSLTAQAADRETPHLQRAPAQTTGPQSAGVPSLHGGAAQVSRPVLSKAQGWKAAVAKEAAEDKGSSSGATLIVDQEGSEYSSSWADDSVHGSAFGPVHLRKELFAIPFGETESNPEDKIVVESTSGERNAKMPPGILTPFGKNRWRWDMYMMLLIAYVATFSVFLRSFIPVIRPRTPWFWIEILIDVSFTVDVILCFRTAYITRHLKLETDKRRIVMHYLKTWFTVDALGTFPWDLLAYFALNSRATIGWLQLPRLLRLFRIFKVMRTLRAFRFKQHVTRLEVRLRLKYGYIRLAWLIVVICLIAHWGGCLFYLVGVLSGPVESSWIGQEGVPADKAGRYLYSVYYTTVTITTVGYGDVTPQNALERVYSIVLMLVGALTLAYIISQVGEIVAGLSSKESLYRQRVDELTEFVGKNSVPPELAFDLRRYFQHRATYLDTEEFQPLLRLMSPYLRAKVMAHLYEDTLNASVLLGAIDNGRREDVYVSMISGLARPGEALYMEGDKSECIFTVLHGHVVLEDSEHRTTKVGQGAVFGEDELLFNRCRRGSARAVEYCSYARVPRDAIMAVLRRDKRAIRDLRNHEVARLWSSIVEHAEREVKFWMLSHRVLAVARREQRHRLIKEVERIDASRRLAPVADSDGPVAPTSVPPSIIRASSAVTEPSAAPRSETGQGDGISRVSDGEEDDGSSSSSFDSDSANSLAGLDMAGWAQSFPITEAHAVDADKRTAVALTRGELESEYVSRGQHLVHLLAKIRVLAGSAAALHAEVAKAFPAHGQKPAFVGTR